MPHNNENECLQWHPWKLYITLLYSPPPHAVQLTSLTKCSIPLNFKVYAQQQQHLISKQANFLVEMLSLCHPYMHACSVWEWSYVEKLFKGIRKKLEIEELKIKKKLKIKRNFKVMLDIVAFLSLNKFFLETLATVALRYFFPDLYAQWNLI